MIKSSEYPQTFYKSNIRQIKVNKRNHNNNIKNNSPSLSHQENNYFYNTKINRLILQEAPNNNRIQNIYKQPGLYNKNVYIEYDFLANSPNYAINHANKQVQTLYKKNENFKKIPVKMKKGNNKDVNDFYYKQDSNSNAFKYVDNNINNSNNYNQNTKGYFQINDNNYFYNRYNLNDANNINSNSFNKNNDIFNNDNSDSSQRNIKYLSTKRTC